MHIDANARLAQCVKGRTPDAFGLRRRQLYDIQVPCGLATRILPRQNKRGGLEQLIISACEFAATGDIEFQAIHLTEAQRRLYVREAIVETQFDLLVIPRALSIRLHLTGYSGDPMSSKSTHALRKCCVLGDCHTAFAGGDDFDRVKAENDDITVTTGSDPDTVPNRSNRV